MPDTQLPDPKRRKAPGEAEAGRRAEPGRPGADVAPAPDDTYEPSTVEVNRGREQGLGVGQKDIDYQHDPTGATPAERWVNPEPGPRVRPLDPLPPELDPPPDH